MDEVVVFHTDSTSWSELETEAGELPPSIVIFGSMYQFKEFVKDQFNTIRYIDLVFDGIVKARARPALTSRPPSPWPSPHMPCPHAPSPALCP